MSYSLESTENESLNDSKMKSTIGYTLQDEIKLREQSLQITKRSKEILREKRKQNATKEKNKTPKNTQSIKKRKTYVCYCGKGYTTSNALGRHVTNIHKKNFGNKHQYACAVCSITLRDKYIVKQHLKSMYHVPYVEFYSKELAKDHETINNSLIFVVKYDVDDKQLNKQSMERLEMLGIDANYSKLMIRKKLVNELDKIQHPD